MKKFTEAGKFVVCASICSLLTLGIGAGSVAAAGQQKERVRTNVCSAVEFVPADERYPRGSKLKASVQVVEANKKVDARLKWDRGQDPWTLVTAKGTTVTWDVTIPDDVRKDNVYVQFRSADGSLTEKRIPIGQK